MQCAVLTWSELVVWPCSWKTSVSNTLLRNSCASIRLENHLMRALKPWSDIWEVFPKWIIFVSHYDVTLPSWLRCSRSSGRRPSLIVFLLPQLRGHNCGAGRGAGGGAELRSDGGGGGQRRCASQKVGLPVLSTGFSHPPVCLPLIGSSHSLSLFHPHSHVTSCLLLLHFLAALSSSAGVQISSLRNEWIEEGFVCKGGQESHNNSRHRGNSKAEKLV